MGTHARPRRRVRAAAFGTLAVGATLTGVGLTAAALDQSGAALADGTLSTEPVNFAASGLGAPVPVADVSSLDGSSAGKSVVLTESGSSDGTGADNGAGARAVLGGYGGYRDHVTSGQTAGPRATGAKGAGSTAAGSTAAGQTASAASSRVSQVKTVTPTVTAPRSNPAPASVGGGSGSGVASAGGLTPKTSVAPGGPAVSTGSRSASGSGSGVGTSTAPATQFPSLPALDAHLPISTALPVPDLPSLPSLPTVASLTTTVDHAKSTVAVLLDRVAGLV